MIREDYRFATLSTSGEWLVFLHAELLTVGSLGEAVDIAATSLEEEQLALPVSRAVEVEQVGARLRLRGAAHSSLARPDEASRSGLHRLFVHAVEWIGDLQLYSFFAIVCFNGSALSRVSPPGEWSFFG